MTPRLPSLVCLALLVPPPGAGSAEPATRLAAHVLNRLAYGPRPGDVERVARIGPEAWIRQQLHPQAVDETALGERLAGLETLGLSSAELRGQMKGSPRTVLLELQAERVIRAVHAERQLEEVMVEFWLNHFNVFARKGPLRFAVGEYERTAIRPHALGRFEDLLLATARSPAMLFYLDNWLSVDPAAAAATARAERRARRSRPDAPPGGRRPARQRGLNENYARELLELHTLGVDGGYTQQDVTELARILTGWTIRGRREGEPAFAFDARLHDDGTKILLGERVEPDGVREGEATLRRLARHPSTAHFVSFKLARRFVADEPPPELVERVASVFTRSGGDIRQVLESIFASPEFLDPQYRGAKVKTPLELVASSVRVLGGEVEEARGLLRTLDRLGMPPLLSAPPTGYPDVADAWVSTSGTLTRLAFATALARGGVRGVALPAGALAAGLEPALPVELSEATRDAVRDQGGGARGREVALLLGSPEFQRR